MAQLPSDLNEQVERARLERAKQGVMAEHSEVVAVDLLDLVLSLVLGLGQAVA